jgi:hypothetical protein
MVSKARPQAPSFLLAAHLPGQFHMVIGINPCNFGLRRYLQEFINDQFCVRPGGMGIASLRKGLRARADKKGSKLCSEWQRLF